MSGIFDQIINYSPPLIVSGTVNYKGTWNASTNNPTLNNPPVASTKGDYYVVNTAGTQFSITFGVGDWIISNGTAWEKVDLTDAVHSVFGRTGAVVGVSTDYSAVGLTNTAIGAANPSSGAFTSLSSSSTTTLNGTTVPASKTLVVTTDKLSALAATTSAELAGVISDETGSGALVFATSPTLVTPILGTPQSGTLTSCTGLPISTGVSGLGTGIATALAVNTGSAGAPVLFNGALGTPTSGTVTNLTGTASINTNGAHNGTVGATTPSTGAFTTLSATGAGFNGGKATFESTNSGNSIDIKGVNGAGINDSAFITLRDGTGARDSFIGLTGDAAPGGAGAIRFATGGNVVRATITSTGNIGFGTASPLSFALQTLQFDSGTVNTALAAIAYGASPSINLRNSGGTAASPSASSSNPINLVGATTNDGTNFFNTISIIGGIESTPASGSHPTFVSFSTTTSGSTSRAERLRITGAGDVGIGTTSPAVRLDVVPTSTDGDITALRLYNNKQTSAATKVSLQFYADNDQVLLTAGRDGAGTSGTFNILTRKSGTQTSSLFINETGNVGIGVTAPGDKLEIGGSGSGIILASANGTRYRVTVTNLGVLNVAAV